MARAIECVPDARPVEVASSGPTTPDRDILLPSASSWILPIFDIGLLVCGCIIIEGIVQGCILAAVGGAEASSKDFIEMVSFELVGPLMIVRFLAVALVIALILKWRKQTRHTVGVTSKNILVDFALGIASAVVAGITAQIVMMFLFITVPAIRENMMQNEKNLRGIFPDMPIYCAVSLMFLVSMWEETFFRGFILTRLRRACGSWTLAVVVSTLMFASLHIFDQQAAAMIPVSILAVVLSLVTIWRRSIVPAIIGHAVWNIAVLLMLTYGPV